jgi:hypothetical protein
MRLHFISIRNYGGFEITPSIKTVKRSIVTYKIVGIGVGWLTRTYYIAVGRGVDSFLPILPTVIKY